MHTQTQLFFQGAGATRGLDGGGRGTVCLRRSHIWSGLCMVSTGVVAAPGPMACKFQKEGLPWWRTRYTGNLEVRFLQGNELHLTPVSTCTLLGLVEAKLQVVEQGS